MKKIFAILMAAVMLLGLLAGCGEKAPEVTEDTTPVADPIAAGMLVLNVNGAVNITYDADGFVYSVEGVDSNGDILAGEYSDYQDKSCSDVICDLIARSKLSGFMLPEIHYILIKQAVGSALPSDDFMETIEKDAEAAVAKAELLAEVVLLTEDSLDEEGYINLESAKGILLAALGLDAFDTIDGTVSPIDGMYGFSITADDLTGDYIVDAVTGLVIEGQLEGHDYGDEDYEDPDMIDSTEETTEETHVEDATEESTVPATEEDVTISNEVEEEEEEA